MKTWGHFAPRVAPQKANRKFPSSITKPRNKLRTTKSIYETLRKTKNSWRVSALIYPSTLEVFISWRTASHGEVEHFMLPKQRLLKAKLDQLS